MKLVDPLSRPWSPAELEAGGFMEELRQLANRQEDEPHAGEEYMDTLGTLVDKLVTVNMKMWHNQEHLYAIRRMTAEEFADCWGSRLPELHAVVSRCCDLNVQRASLMDAIDKFLRTAVGEPENHGGLVREQHKTY